MVSPGGLGGTDEVDLSNVTFVWYGSKGADQYRIEVSPDNQFARDQTWCVDVNEKTTTYAPLISRTFTDVLNASPELADLAADSTLYWRIGARNSADDPGAYPMVPNAQISGAKNTRWIYCTSRFELRIAAGG
jgi:hypothetical protein